MTDMTGNILNRVRRLPKPTKASEALQPIFEAVSNAIHAVEDNFETDFLDKGRINVVITNVRKSKEIEIIISDNGIGLNQARFGAFCTTDTDFKFKKGGKGIGRLLWLDAFEETSVVSVFRDEDDGVTRRSFRFQLTASDQIADEKLTSESVHTPTGTIIKFRGLRGRAYPDKFPTQTKALIRYFGSHFLAEFILGRSPQITLSIGEESAVFPEDVSKLLVENRGVTQIATAEFGTLDVANFICNKAASADFDGLHQLHFIANGRTVMTRKLDGLLGIPRFGDDDDHVYHGCVSGDFLNERVNQERTHFNFDEGVVDQLAKTCSEAIRSGPLQNEIVSFDSGRLSTMREFLDDYPSFGFEAPEQLLAKTPKNAVKAEQFAQALIATRIRRDIDRRKAVQDIVSTLSATEWSAITGDFTDAVRKAADEVRAEEQRQLTEYVLRRKMVLDVLDALIRRVRAMPSGQDDHHLESTLHQFICPMKVRGDDPTRVEGTDHDLWVIDERLAFAKYFASDVPMTQLIDVTANTERPDIFLFDKLHGLGLDETEPLTRAILVEFKKPGRKDYDERYSPMNQISRYLTELAGGQIENFNRERIRVAPDCIFYCYVIADIVGTLDMHTSTWRTTANGRGRWIELGGKFRGSIEIIEWKDLVKDARARNQAFIHAAGA